jgi:23S rRNA pseudouridine1911/1915/1917 synthase
MICLEALAGPEDEGRRFDQVLAACFPEVSRRRIRLAIDWGGAYIEGRRVKVASRRVRAGQRLTLCLYEDPAQYRLREIPAKVLYEDDVLLALNKPSGVPSQGTREDDRNHMLRVAVDHVTRTRGIRKASRVRILHRLDWGTSGVLLFALHPRAHDLFIQPHKPRKTYLALVAGAPPQPSGRIEAPLGPHPRFPGRQAVLPQGGKEARTRYRVLRRLHGATLVAAALLTGRTHQLRLHMVHIGCPILGDDFYGGAEELEGPRSPVQVPRLMLHAARVALTHPATRRPIAIRAPLPETFHTLIAALDPDSERMVSETLREPEAGRSRRGES